jgi:hypothetical protein
MTKHPVPSIGALPADPGLLNAEFQRYQAILTMDEARRCWGGLDAYPNAQVGMTPLNPSMQAAVQQALNPQPQVPPGGPEGEDGQFGGEEDGEQGQEAPAGPPQGFGGEVSDRLHSLAGTQEDE